MRDRTPAPGKANRVKITQDDGTVVEGVLAYADDATQEGSAYTKGNVLPDNVCSLLRLDPVTCEPKDAWLGVISALGYCLVTIQARGVKGTPIVNRKIEGLTGIPDDKTYTDSNGNLFLIMQEGTYYLTIPSLSCIDATMPQYTLEISGGDNITATMQMASKSSTTSLITSSQSIMFSDGVQTFDAFLVGGGGGGAGGYGATYNDKDQTWGKPGGGGGGGYTNTLTAQIPTPFSAISCTVGAGGNGGNGTHRTVYSTSELSDIRGDNGGNGGVTSIAGYGQVNGGSGGEAGYGWGSAGETGQGGNGGSGGGDAGKNSSSHVDGYPGASNGADADNGGTGQGTTTRAFGESSYSDYSGGGGGGGAYTNADNGTGGSGGNGGGRGGNYDSSSAGDGTNGLANWGGGGGGGGGSSEGTGGDGGDGGSGMIMLRWVNKS